MKKFFSVALSLASLVAMGVPAQAGALVASKHLCYVITGANGRTHQDWQLGEQGDVLKKTGTFPASGGGMVVFNNQARDFNDYFKVADGARFSKTHTC